MNGIEMKTMIVHAESGLCTSNCCINMKSLTTMTMVVLELVVLEEVEVVGGGAGSLQTLLRVSYTCGHGERRIVRSRKTWHAISDTIHYRPITK